MIIAFACSDQALNCLADTSVETLSQALWIDLLDATPDEIGRVQKATGLAVPTEAEVSDIETSSRLASRDGAMYLSMPLMPLGYLSCRYSRHDHETETTLIRSARAPLPPSASIPLTPGSTPRPRKQLQHRRR
jgi:Mg2+ and Co2+ transporter CorA